MTSRARDLIPLPIRHFLAGIRHKLFGLRTAWEFSRKPFERVRGKPSVLVAVDPPAGGLVKGGRVKLRSLQREFPGSFDAFNVLYIVSSALPAHLDAWIARARHGGARIVWNQNGVGYPAWAGSSTERVNAPMRRHIRSADHVLFQSAFCEEASRRFLTGDIQRSRVLHNAVDTARFQPPLEPVPAEPLRMLMTGSHQAWYRIGVALDVACELAARGVPFHLRIAGPLEFEGGVERARAAIAAHGLGDRIELTGPYSQEEAPGLYRQAHLFLHTQYQDACPSVLIEAMASGLPVVASASGGIPELVGSDGGVLVPVPADWDTIHPPDPAGLAGAVETVRRDLPRHAAAARDRACRLFDEKDWIESHRAIFLDLLGDPAS